MNYILYTYTTEARQKYAKILQKCFTKYNIKNFFVYHSPQSKNLIEPSLIFPEKEIYENISLKTYHCLNHFLKTDYDFFIKMNDDCIVDIAKLNKHFESFKKYDVVGFIVNNNYSEYSDKDLFKIKHIHYFKLQKNTNLKEQQVFNIPYPEGSFYILSRAAVKKILSKFNKNDFVKYLNEFVGEDTTIGIFLNAFPELTFLDIKHIIEFPMNITKDYISIHPVKHLFMEKLLALEDKDKLEFLSSIQFSNEYILKEKFLDELYETRINSIKTAS